MKNKDEVKDIVSLIKKFENECKSYGVKELTIKKLLNGVEVRTCPYCFTYNLVQISSNKKKGFDMYECFNCFRTYLDDYSMGLK